MSQIPEIILHFRLYSVQLQFCTISDNMEDTNPNIFRGRGNTRFGKHVFRSLNACRPCSLDPSVNSGWGCNYSSSSIGESVWPRVPLKSFPMDAYTL
jgi:hypothetical protein